MSLTGNGRSQPAPADRATLRRINLSVVLRHLRDHGGQSRTSLSDQTGIPKATVSSLIAELAGAGLVREGEIDRSGSIGRPRTAVELDGRTVHGLGIEVRNDHLSAVGLDLAGEVTVDRRTAVDVRNRTVEDVLDEVATVIRGSVDAAAGDGPRRTVGVTLAVPGVIDAAAGSVRIAPNLGWRDVEILRGLGSRLGPDGPPIYLENDAKASTVAEYTLQSAQGVHDLLYITGDVGVGAGMVAAGQLLRGTAGFAGEVGHLPLNPDPRPCACGRTGCWETMIGLAGLLREAAGPTDDINDPAIDLQDRLATVRQRADAGDPQTLRALATIADGLGLGAGILVEILNPKALILGGYFTYFADYLLAPVQKAITARVIAPAAGGCLVGSSGLGLTAAARGGALLALERVFEDPAATLSPTSRSAALTTSS